MEPERIDLDIRSALDACGPLRELPGRVRDGLLARMTRRELGQDVAFIRQGEPGDYLYLIVDGKCRARVHDPADGAHHEVGTFGPGDIVGEMALLTREPRTADVVTRTPVTVLALSVEGFDKLASEHVDFAIVLTHLLAARLGEGGRDGLGGKVVEGYRIGRRLGRGGMSVVYEALAPSGDRVALKMMSHRLLYRSGSVTRFLEEAEVGKRLRHRNVARLYDQFPAYKTYFLVMELVSGPSLYDILKRHDSLPEETVRPILGQLARGLLYVHGAGVIHRDLKPGNALVDEDGSVKLVDFGLARPTMDDTDRTQTDPNIAIGTPRYMPPEQIAGAAIDTSADVYALGAMTYELLAGKPAFDGRNFVVLIQQKMGWRTPFAEEIGAGVSEPMHRFLHAALQPESANRLVDLETIAAWEAPVDPALLSTRSTTGGDP